MCGINGIYGLNDKTKASSLVTAMNNALSHRGPDNAGVFTESKVALGHRRLSIIDLSSAGHQPMQSADGRYQIVYNGELYNFKEIKKKLPDYPFKTNTDTEVIIAAYHKWGKECLHQFNGMFAFALWDDHKQELFIVRDRLGIKPLYYHYHLETLVFSSEIRSLLASGLIERKINTSALTDYIRYQTVHAPETIIQDVKMLMPGHWLCIGKSGFEIKQYWNILEKGKENPENNYSTICKNTNELLTKAVERRLIADVPFGAFLSGGIDSSAIVGLMAKVSDKSVETFNINFDESEFSEAKYAKLIAKKFNTRHHEIQLTATDFLNDLPYALNAMDHPSGDGPNTYVVSKATKKAGITMALSGLGGDELFAGYDIFKRSLKLNEAAWVNHVPYSLRNLAGTLINVLKKDVAGEKLKEVLQLQYLTFTNTYPLSRMVLGNEQIKKIIPKHYNQQNPVWELAQTVSQSFNAKTNTLSRVSVSEISTYMQNILLRDTDQMSMAHALEVRVPFLDYTLVEYVIGLRDNFKHPVTPKKLLIDSLGKLLPSEIIDRTKMGFTFPWKHWMKNELNSFCEENIHSLSQRDFINGVELKNLWHRFQNNDARITWSRLWHLIVLEHWIQQNKIEA